MKITNIAIRHNEPHGWYIVGKNSHGINRFLHQDGTWKASTSSDGEFSGYYPSEEEAKKALTTYRQTQSTKKKPPEK